jgi:putative effector of murein hydrolase
MKNNETALWLIVAVALGLFAYSLTSILFNGFRFYMAYPLLLGIVNLLAFWLLRKG